ncbi:RNA polymerase sigma factor SigM [Dermacoccus nishinomiyaensis]|uniref:RNA polymerase sigma factor SigM n=1 Tax=Dermacoccus nishinomiyaensis TaxID=1274 RepID=UPI0021B4B9EA|nr:RNA polymerase sigma factor SigM [Dermacoccus nishinomiyaensis]
MNGSVLRDSTDEELVQAHREGDPDAFGVLFERYKDRMWSVALRTTRDPELAADAVQEGFLAAFRRLESFRGDAKFSTWLHRVVVNSALDRLRRLKPTQEWPEYDIADTRDAHAQTDVRLDVRQALAQLPEGQRLCLVLVDMEGLSVAEAATHLGVAEGTVKSRCARGRTALAGMLADR